MERGASKRARSKLPRIDAGRTSLGDLHGRGWLRGEGERDHQVSSTELFFDLVFVFAITQLSHLLITHLDPIGAFQTALLMVALWWAWVDTAWLTNWFDPERRPVRFMLIGLMVATLIMAVALPEAFGDRGLLFAIAFAALQVGRFAFAVGATHHQPQLHRNFQRILVWRSAAGVLWLAGGLVAGPARVAFWIAAVVLETIGPACGFWTPGLGRSTTQEWHISAAHMAERCKLFLIIALGESILVIGATFTESDFTLTTLAAFIVAFLNSVALWWVYFDLSFDAAERAFESSSDPGRLGRFAYTYLHAVMVAGIVVMAVGDELIIGHPLGHTSPEIVATVLGGPTLFLAGHLLFKWAVLGAWSVPRLAAIAAFGIIAVVGSAWPPLALSLASLLMVAAVSWQDLRTHRAPVSVTRVGS